jgi:hypothetical protein
MGETAGTPLGAGDLRALNQPHPIDVAVDERGIPRIVRVTTGQLRVIDIADTWRVDDGWWRPESEQIKRLYFELTLENGAHLTLFHDLVRGSWHAQRA